MANGVEESNIIKEYNPRQFPENPFDYRKLAGNPRGIGVIPLEKRGTQIAIIGAGASGLCAAYELMKMGLHPVVYESATYPDGSPRIGGRLYTYRFPGDPRALAELGAMRIPPVHSMVTYYMDRFGIDYSQKFPNPLVVPTHFYFNGKRHFIPAGGELTPEIDKAYQAWNSFILSVIGPLARVWDDPTQRAELWQKYVQKYANKTFYGVLQEYGITKEDIHLFGSLGFGTGGFDSMFPISFIEILRLVGCKWEVDQRLIKGGVDQIAMNFWTELTDSLYWGKQCVRDLNEGKPLPAVKEIFTPAYTGDDVVLTDVTGAVRKFAAVVVSCTHHALEMNIRVNEPTFTSEVWSALRNLHMVNSGKVFVRTKTAFWKHHPPGQSLACTITDEPIRGAYMFDFEDTPSGVICLSYTWGDSAVKFNALSHEERVERSIRCLEKIYGQDLISDQVEETFSFFWEQAKGYHGAFKLTHPGQYDRQRDLFLQPFVPGPEKHNGVFLAGESVYWGGGWVECALQAGLNAAMAVVYRLDGQCSDDIRNISTISAFIDKKAEIIL